MPGGTQRMTLHLEPDTLGYVQIQIDRPPDAGARVAILSTGTDSAAGRLAKPGAGDTTSARP